MCHSDLIYIVNQFPEHENVSETPSGESTYEKARGEKWNVNLSPAKGRENNLQYLGSGGSEHGYSVGTW